MDQATAQLIRAATGEVPHTYRGACPDALEGFTTRDPDCPACQAITATEAPTHD